LLTAAYGTKLPSHNVRYSVSLSGVKRTYAGPPEIDANDPFRSSADPKFRTAPSA
jgi:hypothetical protein